MLRSGAATTAAGDAGQTESPEKAVILIFQSPMSLA
jgi:hypothetical protein